MLCRSIDPEYDMVMCDVQVPRLEMKQLIDRSSADSHKAEFGAILVNALESIWENSGEAEWRDASKRMLQLLQVSRPGQGVRKD